MYAFLFYFLQLSSCLCHAAYEYTAESYDLSAFESVFSVSVLHHIGRHMLFHNTLFSLISQIRCHDVDC